MMRARAATSAVARAGHQAVLTTRLSMQHLGKRPSVRQVRRAARCDATATEQHNHGTRAGQAVMKLVTGTTACIAAAMLALTPLPASADLIETVPASQATTMAKPIAKQEFNKGRIWLVLVGGALGLFGLTLVVENNESLFPAISRANKAMKMSREAAAAGYKPADDWQSASSQPSLPQTPTSVSFATDDELAAALTARRLAAEEEERQLNVFREGLAQASKEVLGKQSSSSSTSSVLDEVLITA